MASTTLKAVTGNQVAEQKKPTTIGGLLSDPRIKQQMALALPRHMTADRLARIALTEVRKNPKLASADQTSFLGAIMQCAQLGLEPGGALGHCYLLPFENRRKQIVEVQFIVGYRGMIDLARRSGQIVSLSARSVHDGDHFEYEYGLQETVVHRPSDKPKSAETLLYVYAVAKLKDGGVQFEVMSRSEIERVRDESNGYKVAQKYGNDSPWTSHFEEMAKKTVIRRLFKYLPVSIELSTAVGLDEQSEGGLPQDNPLTIDSDSGEITGGLPDQAASPTIPSADRPDTGAEPDDQPGRDEPEHPSAARQEGAGGAAKAPGRPTYAQLATRLSKAADKDAADLILDEARALPADQQRDLKRLADERWPAER